jgi:hypothetical protein
MSVRKAARQSLNQLEIAVASISGQSAGSKTNRRANGSSLVIHREVEAPENLEHLKEPLVSQYPKPFDYSSGSATVDNV